MFKPVLAGILVSLNLNAAEPVFNFQDVELFSFSCESVSQAKKITGSEWNREEAILRVFKTVDQVEEVLEYEVTKSFVGKSLIMLGKPIDGSEGRVQFILRNAKASTVVINSTGATKLDCKIELL